MEMVILFIKNNTTRLFLLILLIIIWFINYKSNDNFSLCLFKSITSKECFACGTLRGISALLHMDFRCVINLNKFNIISLPVLSIVYISALKNNRI